MNIASLPGPHAAAGAAEPRQDDLTPSAGGVAWPVAMLGLPLDRLGATEALGHLEAMAASRQHHYVVTAGPALVAAAVPDLELRRALAGADLLLPVGVVLRSACRWLGNPIPERFDEAAFCDGVLALARERIWRIFVLENPGCTAAVTPPGLLLAGHALVRPDGPEAESEAAIRQIRAADADLVIVRTAEPAAHAWVARHHAAFGRAVCLHLASTLDLLPYQANAPGAPVPWSRLARRAALTFGAAAFIAGAAAWQRRRMARPTAAGANPAVTGAGNGWTHLDAGTALTRDALIAHAGFYLTLPDQPGDWTLDLSRVRQIDATGLAFLARCQKAADHAGRRLLLVAPSRAVAAALHAGGFDHLFNIAASARDARRLTAGATDAPRPPAPGAMRSLAWCGEVIAANVEDVWEMTTGYVRGFATAGATLVVIDLSRVRLVDSAGATLMQRVKTWARSLPAEILFAHPPRPVRHMLELNHSDVLLLEGAQ